MKLPNNFENTHHLGRSVLLIKSILETEIWLYSWKMEKVWLYCLTNLIYFMRWALLQTFSNSIKYWKWRFEKRVTFYNRDNCNNERKAWAQNYTSRKVKMNGQPEKFAFRRVTTVWKWFNCLIHGKKSQVCAPIFSILIFSFNRCFEFHTWSLNEL